MKVDINNKNKIKGSTVVCRYAVASRCILAALILLWRTVISPYDTSSSINPACIAPHRYPNAPNSSLQYSGIGSTIQNIVVWDSVYFLRIAECGYEYEQTYAFFPLLPLLVTFLSRTALFPLIPLIGYRAVLTLAGYIICNSAFIVSAVYFYRFSEIVLKNKDAAFRASILFCFNPASIFYSSIYSESLYSLCFIGGLYHLSSGEPNKATLWWSLSSLARSNGIINVGHFCYQAFHQLCDTLMRKKRVSVKLFLHPVRCLCVIAPFLAFQTYGYFQICLADNSRPWCQKKIPLMYSYIQSEYWGVGFLRYYQLKQIPNFLLALPTLATAVSSIVHFRKEIAEDFSPSNLVTKKNNIISVIVPCTIHLGFMVASATLFMHVQVATRFLSASPPIYWYAAYLMGTWAHIRWSYLIWAYSSVYVLIGSLLFSTFYPFT